jgi:hypothetical protein
VTIADSKSFCGGIPLIGPLLAKFYECDLISGPVQYRVLRVGLGVLAKRRESCACELKKIALDSNPLDILWLKDKSLEDSPTPKPDIIAREIARR